MKSNQVTFDFSDTQYFERIWKEEGDNLEVATILLLNDDFIVFEDPSNHELFVMNTKSFRKKRLKGHTELVSGFIKLDDDHFGSFAEDRSLRIWNWKHRILVHHIQPIYKYTMKMSLFSNDVLPFAIKLDPTHSLYHLRFLEWKTGNVILDQPVKSHKCYWLVKLDNERLITYYAKVVYIWKVDLKKGKAKIQRKFGTRNTTYQGGLVSWRRKKYLFIAYDIVGSTILHEIPSGKELCAIKDESSDYDRVFYSAFIPPFVYSCDNNRSGENLILFKLNDKNDTIISKNRNKKKKKKKKKRNKFEKSSVSRKYKISSEYVYASVFDSFFNVYASLGYPGEVVRFSSPFLPSRINLSEKKKIWEDRVERVNQFIRNFGQRVDKNNEFFDLKVILKYRNGKEVKVIRLLKILLLNTRKKRLLELDEYIISDDENYNIDLFSDLDDSIILHLLLGHDEIFDEECMDIHYDNIFKFDPLKCRKITKLCKYILFFIELGLYEQSYVLLNFFKKQIVTAIDRLKQKKPIKKNDVPNELIPNGNNNNEEKEKEEENQDDDILSPNERLQYLRIPENLVYLLDSLCRRFEISRDDDDDDDDNIEIHNPLILKLSNIVRKNDRIQMCFPVSSVIRSFMVDQNIDRLCLSPIIRNQKVRDLLHIPLDRSPHTLHEITISNIKKIITTHKQPSSIIEPNLTLIMNVREDEGNFSVRVHREVLFLCSNYFSKMVSFNGVECEEMMKENKIRISPLIMEKNQLKNLIHYAYNNSIHELFNVEQQDEEEEEEGEEGEEDKNTIDLSTNPTKTTCLKQIIDLLVHSDQFFEYDLKVKCYSEITRIFLDLYSDSYELFSESVLEKSQYLFGNISEDLRKELFSFFKMLIHEDELQRYLKQVMENNMEVDTNIKEN